MAIVCLRIPGKNCPAHFCSSLGTTKEKTVTEVIWGVGRRRGRGRRNEGRQKGLKTIPRFPVTSEKMTRDV